MTISVWFTTLTLLGPEHCDAVKNIIKRYSKKYMIIKEKGAAGTNPHIHVCYASNHYTRGTKFNEHFKQEIYAPNKIPVKRVTIQTISVYDKMEDFLAYYFFKEGNSLHETVNEGFSDEELTTIFSNRVLRTKKLRLKYDEAPYKIYELLKDIRDEAFSYGTLINAHFEYAMIELIKQNYFVTHLLKHRVDICDAVYLIACAEADKKLSDDNI